MDFFLHQDTARRRTALLVLLLMIALIVIGFAVYGVVALILQLHHKPAPPLSRPLWDPKLFCEVMLAVAGLVLGGSAWKYAQLASGGGWRVAQMLGAEALDPDSAEPEERRFLNVVEEMSIASGVPVPVVFVLREVEGINAFAAGTGFEDAVLAVSRGCLYTLSRDEQQAVVAHEFSHILNGDMRFNLRLIGILHGIIMIALIGRLTFGIRSVHPFAVILFYGPGLLLMAVGYGGALMSRLIRMAITRQREFLADAAAVQFTRNPEALVNVLLKIRLSPARARVDSPVAETVSHMFLANGVSAGSGGLLATHPPIAERIFRIAPALDEVELERRQEALKASGFSDSARAGTPFPVTSGLTGARGDLTLTPDRLRFAHGFLKQVPAGLSRAIRQAPGAEAVVYGLLLSAEPSAREKQLGRIQAHAGPETLKQFQELQADVETVEPQVRLPLVDLSIPALRRLPADRQARFKENVRHLASADRRISFFEYALQKAFMKRLAPAGQSARRARVRYRDAGQLELEAAELLSILAWQVHAEPPEALSAFRKAFQLYRPQARPPGILPREKAGLQAFDKALDAFLASTHAVKRGLLGAAETCIFSDRRITMDRIELLRILACALEVPVSVLPKGEEPIAPWHPALARGGVARPASES
jgi:Zn-dependent protease with chaperone function